MSRLITALVLSLMLNVFTLGTAQAAYPDHPVMLIVPFGAGGTTDVPARILAHALEKKLGQPVMVQNIAGGGGTQGAAQAAAAQADGYTLLYAPTGTMVLQPHMGKTPYGKDSFEMLGNVMKVPVVLMSSPNAPWKNIQEMIEVVGKEPGKYIVAITGMGNMTHVPMLALAQQYGLKFRTVPYKSAPEIFKDMAAGRTHLFADTPVGVSMGMQGLLQYAERPFEGVHAPTTASIGLSLYMEHWQAMFAPRNLPADVKETLVNALREVVNDPQFKADAERLSTAAGWIEPDAFKAYFDKEFDEYGGLLKETLSRK